MSFQSETSGFLENYRRTVPADFTVSPSSSDAYEDNTLYPLTPVEGFVIADGKLLTEISLLSKATLCLTAAAALQGF